MTTPAIPPKPPLVLGQPAPVPVASAERIDRLRVRRSAPAQALTGPGPDAAQTALLLEIGARTPDHGKLFPWRFLIIEGEAKARLVEKLTPLAETQRDPAKARAVLAKLANPPLTITVIARPTPHPKIPEWEQELSAGAVCMNLLHAADAMGFSASWITDWYAYDPAATALLGLAPGERVAGFVHVGVLAEPAQERVRPDLAALTRVWRG